MTIPPLDKGLFLALTALAIGIGVHAARGIYKTGVEHYAGRILLHSAILNMTSVALLLVLFGAASLRGVLTPARFHEVDLLVAALFLTLPAKAGWNYLKAPARIKRRFNLLPPRTGDPPMEVSAVANAIGVSVPTTLSSPQCQTPFVFGRNSRQVYLALPDAWSSLDDNSRSVMLLHELAHIRNRDVGFSTWSVVFLQDLKWALLLSPIVIALSLWGGQEYLAQATLLYVGCLLILYVLTNTVLRSRELRADATVAMLIDSGQIVRTFEEILLTPVTGLYLGDTDSPGLILRMRSWLADQAMFSTHATIWKTPARAVEWALATHPTVATRRSAIRGKRAAGEDSSVRNGEAFWAGSTLGLLGVLIALGGFWTGKYVLDWQDEEQIVRLAYDCGGTVAPLVIVFIALFFVLPAWSSLRPHVPTGRNLVHLLTRYLYGLLGAGCVLPLILLGGWSHPEIKLLFVLANGWVLAILAVGIAANLIMLSLWLSLRYQRRYYFLDLLWMLYFCGIGLAAVICYFAWGLVLLGDGQTLAGGSIGGGLLVGLAVYHTISKDSRVSGTDQYLVIAPPPILLTLEGRAYRRWSPLVGFLHWGGCCIVPAVAVSGIIYKVGDRALGHVGTFVALVVLASLGCAIFLLLDWRWPRRMRDPCRQKTYALVEAQILLPHGLSAKYSETLNRILQGLLVQHDAHGHIGTMTTQKMFELTVLASVCEPSGRPLGERARQWAYACETAAGFGVWPGSGPRLSATYQCLQILQDTGGIQLSDPSRHVAWIRSLQTRDGPFRGPWSYRSRPEDTFFATTSLNLFGSCLEEPAREHCLTWLKETLVREGIEKRQLDAFHYCLAAAHALHGLDGEILRNAGPWLSVELDRLLLTHVGHNAENARHVVCAYQILKERDISLALPERIALLADRVNDALEAELAALRT